MAVITGAGSIGTKGAGVLTFEKKTRDFAADTQATARDIGRVRVNDSRLNLFSALSKGDKEDNFKFAVDSKGDLKLGKRIDKYTRVRIYKNRRVIADSKAGMGRATERYLALASPKGVALDRGDYYIKITRLDTQDTTTKHNYSLQLMMGSSFNKDFDTIEYAARPGVSGSPPPVPVPASVVADQGAVGMLASGASFFANMINGAFSAFDRILSLFR